MNFLEDADTKRLLVYVDGKDLGAVRSHALHAAMLVCTSRMDRALRMCLLPWFACLHGHSVQCKC